MLKPLTGLEGWLLAHLNGDKPFTRICPILSWMEGLDVAIFPFQLLCTFQILSEPVRSWIRSSFHFSNTNLIVLQSAVTNILCFLLQPILWLHNMTLSQGCYTLQNQRYSTQPISFVHVACQSTSSLWPSKLSLVDRDQKKL